MEKFRYNIRGGKTDYDKYGIFCYNKKAGLTCIEISIYMESLVCMDSAICMKCLVFMKSLVCTESVVCMGV